MVTQLKTSEISQTTKDSRFLDSYLANQIQFYYPMKTTPSSIISNHLHLKPSNTPAKKKRFAQTVQLVSHARRKQQTYQAHYSFGVPTPIPHPCTSSHPAPHIPPFKLTWLTKGDMSFTECHPMWPALNSRRAWG